MKEPVELKLQEKERQQKRDPEHDLDPTTSSISGYGGEVKISAVMSRKTHCGDDSSNRLEDDEELIEMLVAHHNSNSSNMMSSADPGPSADASKEDNHKAKTVTVSTDQEFNSSSEVDEKLKSTKPDLIIHCASKKDVAAEAESAKTLFSSESSTEKTAKLPGRSQDAAADASGTLDRSTSEGTAVEATAAPRLSRTSGRTQQAGAGSGPGAYALSSIEGERRSFLITDLPPPPPSAILEANVTSGTMPSAISRESDNNNNASGDLMIEATAVDDVVEAHAKKLEWWTPRKIRGVIGGTLAAVAIILAIVVTVVVTTRRDDDSSNRETEAPTLPPMERLQAMEDMLLVEAYNNNNNNSNASAILNDPMTPQYRSLQWLALNDTLYVSLDDVDHLIQRYALGVLYFATGGPVTWMESFEFLEPEHECSWSGALQCGDGDRNNNNGGTVVTGIELQENGLLGMLPGVELGLLSNLQFLALGSNDLSGTLPPMLPAQLTLLDLSRNGFTGSIPDEFATMTHLESLDIKMNDLNGTIPKNFGALSKLTSLDIESNYLTGFVPDSMWDLTNMETFIIESQLKLSGTIAPRVGLWKNVSVFLINMNNNITGSLPTELGLLTNLVEFKTAQSHMTGTIPTEFGLLTNMKFLALSRNGYTGSVPTELALLSNLHQMYLQTTLLSGDMIEFCQEMDSGKLPFLTTLIADKMEVTNCTCCTCCDY